MSMQNGGKRQVVICLISKKNKCMKLSTFSSHPSGRVVTGDLHTLGPPGPTTARERAKCKYHS